MSITICADTSRCDALQYGSSRTEPVALGGNLHALICCKSFPRVFHDAVYHLPRCDQVPERQGSLLRSRRRSLRSARTLRRAHAPGRACLWYGQRCGRRRTFCNQALQGFRRECKVHECAKEHDAQRPGPASAPLRTCDRRCTFCDQTMQDEFGRKYRAHECSGEHTNEQRKLVGTPDRGYIAAPRGLRGGHRTLYTTPRPYGARIWYSLNIS